MTWIGWPRRPCLRRSGSRAITVPGGGNDPGGAPIVGGPQASGVEIIGASMAPTQMIYWRMTTCGNARVTIASALRAYDKLQLELSRLSKCVARQLDVRCRQKEEARVGRCTLE